MIPDATGDVAVITDPQTLQELVTRLRREEWVAVDTEFMRERTYYPKLCLIQLAGPAELACVDPLAIADLTPLAALWTDPGVTKIFHAASQDLEILLQATQVMPQPLFDSQVAAALLGYPDQIGYARLVTDRLGVTLPKQHTRSDWSRRPLSDQEIAYAADDVRYLARLYPDLQAALEHRGRLTWLQAECCDLAEPARYRPDPEQAWRRLRAARQLKPRQRHALARLAAWRERRAMDADRPRGWIVKDEVLLKLAQKQPRDADALARIGGLPDGVRKKHGEHLLELLRQPAPTTDDSEDAMTAPLPPERAPFVDLLMAGLRERADATDIAAGALGSRRDVERLVAGERDLPLLRGWRREAVGSFLLGLLEGRLALGAGHKGLDWIDRGKT